MKKFLLFYYFLYYNIHNKFFYYNSFLEQNASSEPGTRKKSPLYFQAIAYLVVVYLFGALPMWIKWMENAGIAISDSAIIIYIPIIIVLSLGLVNLVTVLVLWKKRTEASS